MRVLLRHKKTRLYRTAANGWVAAEEQALGFTSVHHATRVALNERLPEAEIVMKSELMQEEVTMPVLPEYLDFDQGDAAAA
jgi:hypothetical protein